jgi:hypothetical protein
VAGNKATCTFSVKVNDIAPPIIACPANVQVDAPSTGAALVVSWTIPTPSDNQGVSSLASVPIRGASFAIGSTTVVYTVTDMSDLSATCSFNVTVKDVTPPTITCPSNLVESTKLGQNKGKKQHQYDML